MNCSSVIQFETKKRTSSLDFYQTLLSWFISLLHWHIPVIFIYLYICKKKIDTNEMETYIWMRLSVVSQQTTVFFNFTLLTFPLTLWQIHWTADKLLFPLPCILPPVVVVLDQWQIPISLILFARRKLDELDLSNHTLVKYD